MNTIFHSLIEKFYQSKGREFYKNFSQFELFQRQKLKTQLELFQESTFGQRNHFKSIRSYEDFKQQIPLTSYKDYKEDIEKKMLLKQRSTYFQPTSGSTHQKKWIPYTKELKAEFNEAIAPWIYDLYRKYPGIKNGKHYWSLSWLPDEFRDQVTTNDLEVFGRWKKFFMNQIMAVPEEIAMAKTSEAAQLATLIHLASKTDLSMLFVWSPTFALGLFDKLTEKKEEISLILKTGQWGKNETLMKGIPCQKNLRASSLIKAIKEFPDESFFKELWPRMSLISSWDTSSSKIWAKKLQNLFPQASFQGKGLFATEGVVTIPYEESYILSYKSHFYEFKDLESGKIYPSWELKKNQKVSPLLTTGSGFFRYELNDALIVTGFNNHLPCLEFSGRLKDLDLVGEKMSPEFIEEVFKELSLYDQNLLGVCAIGVIPSNDKPYYLFLFEKEESSYPHLDRKIEDYLMKNFHYSLARSLGQLRSSKVRLVKDSRKLLESIALKKGLIQGNHKIEILFQVEEEILKEFECL